MSGKVASVSQSCIAFGTFISCILNETATYYTDSFAFNLLLPMIPSFFTFVSAALIWTTLKYESPIYLWSVNKPNFALQTISQIEGKAYEPTDEIDEEDQDVAKVVVVRYTFKEILKMPVLRRILGQVCLTAFLQQTTGINSVLLYSSYYWKRNVEQPYAGSLISGVAFVSVVLTLFYIDSERYIEAKRKRLAQIGAISLFICNVLMAALITDVVVAFCASIIFVISFELTLGPAMYPLTQVDFI